MYKKTDSNDLMRGKTSPFQVPLQVQTNLLSGPCRKILCAMSKVQWTIMATHKCYKRYPSSDTERMETQLDQIHPNVCKTSSR